jgi:hypothetical protein
LRNISHGDASRRACSRAALASLRSCDRFFHRSQPQTCTVAVTSRDAASIIWVNNTD